MASAERYLHCGLHPLPLHSGQHPHAEQVIHQSYPREGAQAGGVLAHNSYMASQYDDVAS